MTYYCILFDESITDKSKYNNLKSIGHKVLDESNIRRYIFQNPNINDFQELMRKYNKINI